MRLIDADKLEQRLPTFSSVIDEMPTIDAEPVKHGYWYHDDDGHVRCSVCHGREPNGAAIYTYCPNCGARMDLRTVRVNI